MSLPHGFSGIIVGMDCAAQPERFGIAVALLLESGPPKVVTAWKGARDEKIATTIAAAVREALATSPVGGRSMDLIVSLDAPLGWPRELGRTLATHEAGRPLPFPSNSLFRRVTDDVIYEQLGRRPLEVGADRIARAAVQTLSVLEELRTVLATPLPVAIRRWSEQGATASSQEGPFRISCAIEVYPAAYLLANGLPARMYKRVDQADTRASILDGIASKISLPERLRERAASDADVLDSLLCILTATDYLSDSCISPSGVSEKTLRVEGWAWVPRPSSG